MLLDFERTCPSLPKLTETKSLSQLLHEKVSVDRDLRLVLTLLEWVETIKMVDVIKNTETTLCPHPEKNFHGPLDPDSCLKFNEDYKKQFSKVMVDCFRLIRSGQLSKAQSMLRHYNANWAALAIGGLCPYFNSQIYQSFDTENIETSCFSTLDSELPEIDHGKIYDIHEFGNQNIDLFIKTCWELSNNRYGSIAERAVFGSVCGNLEAILEMCEKNPHDHFWAYLRTIFLFSLRNFLVTADDGFKTMENTQERFSACPDEIPAEYPANILLAVTRISKVFEWMDKIYHLQFSLIASAVRGKKEDYILSFIKGTYPGHYTRVLVHCFICLKSLCYSFTRDTVDNFERLLMNYLAMMIQSRTELMTIVFYIRYFSFAREDCYVDFFTDLFSSYPDEASHNLISRELYVYAKPFVQAILCQVALSELQKTNSEISFSTLRDNLEESNRSQPYPDRLIHLIEGQIMPESLPTVIETIRKLAIMGKYRLGNSLVSKAHKSAKDFKNEEFELRYWGNFFTALDTLNLFYSAKLESHSIFAPRNNVNFAFESLQRLDNNPALQIERKTEKCKQIAMQLVALLEEVTGVRYGDFPLGKNCGHLVVCFRSKWWSVCLMALCEAYKEIRNEDGLTHLCGLLNSVWKGNFERNVENDLLRITRG
jgi:hypothetical protein